MTLVITAAIVGVILGAFLLFRHFCKKEKDKLTILQNHMSLEELLISLEFILTTEINIYENILQNTTDTDLTTLQNSEFNAIYKELSMQCLKSVSPQFWELIEVYMTRDSIQTYITQRVYNYLAEKVRG